MEFCANCWIKNVEIGYWYGGGYSTAKVALGILVPVSCVWVPAWMASSLRTSLTEVVTM